MTFWGQIIELQKCVIGISDPRAKIKPNQDLQLLKNLAKRFKPRTGLGTEIDISAVRESLIEIILLIKFQVGPKC